MAKDEQEQFSNWVPCAAERGERFTWILENGANYGSVNN